MKIPQHKKRLADYGSRDRVFREKKRFDKDGSWYTNIVKNKEKNRYELWVREKGGQKTYKLSNFTVKQGQRRTYGSGAGRTTLVMAKVTNKKTGQVFQDWVRPNQIKTGKELNKLIRWR